MADALDKLSVRELLLHLPELISGDDPVLGGVRAAAYVREHPEARAAIVLAGGVVGALQGAPTRLDALPVALPREFRRPLDQARRLLARELMMLLHGTAQWYLDASVREAGGYLVLDNVPEAPPDPDAFERGCLALADQLGLQPGSCPDVVSAGHTLTELFNVGSGSSQSRAERLLDVCGRLCPDDPQVGLTRLVAANPSPVDPRPWLGFARKSTSTGFHASGLAGAALAMAARSDFRQALDIAREIEPWDTSGLSSWNALQHALLAGREREALRWACAYRQSWEGFDQQRREDYARLAAAVDWPQCSVRTRSAFLRVVDCLPSALADIARFQS